jgi:hypothetical protein
MSSITLVSEFTDIIKIKTNLKYSNDFTFVPIRNKDNKDIIVQTTKILIPYGMDQMNETIDVSFNNIDNDPNMKKLYDILNKIYSKILKKYKKYNVNHFLKDKNMRLKLFNCKIFNQKRHEIKTIPIYTYGELIINLSGLWIVKDKIWFNWKALQIKIDEPINLQPYSFINKNIPKPPPLPPPPKKSTNKIIIRKNVKKQLDDNGPMISLDEVKKILNNLNKIKI